MNYLIVFHTKEPKKPEFYHGSCPLDMSKMFRRVVEKRYDSPKQSRGSLF